jgi:hypothetical protein
MSDDEGAMSTSAWQDPDAMSLGGSASEEEKMNDTPSQPIQKRRRVTRACDECRRKKIKCDGKQPCTHCSVYSYGEPRPVDHRPDLGLSLGDNIVPNYDISLSSILNLLR